MTALVIIPTYKESIEKLSLTLGKLADSEVAHQKLLVVVAMEEADAIGQEGMPGEGPFMIVYLKGSKEKIEEATFMTYGCPIAQACGSWLTGWVVGRSAQQAKVIGAEDLMRILGGLPLGKEHCASLAINALKKALRPWEGRGVDQAG